VAHGKGLKAVRVALIHYWLVSIRGGEKVLEALCEIFPEADIFTHVCDRSVLSQTLARHRIRTSFIQRLPNARRWYQKYLPLMPLALEQLDLRGYDLVISSESGPAKGVIVAPGAVHVCYCHSPMRYAWDQYHAYLERAGIMTRALAPPLLHYMRAWDLQSASRVDHFIANSRFVARRIRQYYRRDALVIAPPVDTRNFYVSDAIGDYYLMIGQLVPYKRPDLAIGAFNQMGRKLVVIGEGPEMNALRRKAGPNIEFLGWRPQQEVRDHYARCRALVFPGTEDFGLVPVEAMASGRPVIALRRGGALETVVENETGVFFDEETPEALAAAVYRLEATEGQYSPSAIARHARQFDRSVFKERVSGAIRGFIDQAAS